MSHVGEALVQSVKHLAVFAAETAKFSGQYPEVFTTRSPALLAIGGNRTARIDYSNLGE